MNAPIYWRKIFRAVMAYENAKDRSEQLKALRELVNARLAAKAAA
jgi:hypothetical protein